MIMDLGVNIHTTTFMCMCVCPRESKSFRFMVYLMFTNKRYSDWWLAEALQLQVLYLQISCFVHNRIFSLFPDFC